MTIDSLVKIVIIFLLVSIYTWLAMRVWSASIALEREVENNLEKVEKLEKERILYVTSPWVAFLIFVASVLLK